MLEQVDAAALRVAEHLIRMWRAQHVFLDQHQASLPKLLMASRWHRRQRGREVFAFDQAHALPRAAGAGLMSTG